MLTVGMSCFDMRTIKGPTLIGLSELAGTEFEPGFDCFYYNSSIDCGLDC